MEEIVSALREPRRLSKSRICKGLVCQKALYLDTHHKELASPPSARLEQIFANGHAVGMAAHNRFPSGRLIEASYKEPERALADTQKAIDEGVETLFEGAFLFDDILIRADILHRESVNGPWTLYEVKSTARLKEEHIADVAVQAYVLKGAKLNVESFYLSHLNRKCFYPDLSNLFFDVDLTEAIRDIEVSMPATATKFKKLLQKEEIPSVDIGPHCTDPYECAFRDHCWSHIPKISIFNIPNLKSSRKWELHSKGMIELSQLSSENLNEKQERMVSSTIANERWVDKGGIRKELQELTYPISYLDFETIAPPIPRFEGSAPYAPQIPFQFVCYTVNAPGEEPRFSDYLHPEPSDPRSDLLRALLKCISPDGSIVAYNKGFEASVLKMLAAYDEDHRPELERMVSRLWDPLPVMRKYVYDPAFKGSFRIKTVAPALLGAEASYEDMEVGEGTEAQIAFEKMTAPKTSEGDKKKIETSLREYCKKDTYLMIALQRWLEEQVSDGNGL